MKHLYARLVLWLIRPALEMRSRREAEYLAATLDSLHASNPPRPLAPDLCDSRLSAPIETLTTVRATAVTGLPVYEPSPRRFRNQF